ncbi:MAG: AMP-binding protein [Oceanicoccus sp.]
MTNTAALENFKTPLDMFYQWEAQRPESVWLSMSHQGQWQSYTWSDVGSQSRKIAAALQNMGLQRGDKIGICAANSPHWVMADLACMMGEFVLVPIYATMTPDKMIYVAEHSDMVALFTDGSLDIAAMREVLPAGSPIIAIGDNCASRCDDSWSNIITSTTPVQGSPSPAPDALWTIVYTSGTTGMPKGVMHSHSTLPYAGFGLPPIAGSDINSRLFSYLPLAHAGERVLVELHAIYSGASIAFNENKDSFAADMKAIRPTFLFAVPRIWVNLKAAIVNQLGSEVWQGLQSNPEQALQAGKPLLEAMGLDQCTFAFSGAAPISSKDLHTWQSLGLPLYEGFGQSECMSGTINTGTDNLIGSVGKIIDKVSGDLKIADDGEILLRAPSTMVGYYKNPDKTAETIVDGWVLTGDKGHLDDEGFLHITGRVKEIFKTAKGKYVAPAPVENKFSACPHVEQMCLVGSGLPQTVLLVTLTAASSNLDKEEVADSLEQYRQEVNNAIEAHERMSHVVVCSEGWSIENLLLTHTLKILRDDVEKHHRACIERCENEAIGVIWE